MIDKLRGFFRRAALRLLYGPPGPPAPALPAVTVTVAPAPPAPTPPPPPPFPGFPPMVMRMPAPDTCAWCNEPFDGNQHPMMTGCHVECAVRMVSGSLAHIEKRCGCFVPGSSDHDPPEMSRRAAALEVFQRVREKAHGPAN